MVRFCSFLEKIIFLFAYLSVGSLFAESLNRNASQEAKGASPYAFLPSVMINLNRFSSESLFWGVGIGDILSQGLGHPLDTELAPTNEAEESPSLDSAVDPPGLWVDYMGCFGRDGGSGGGSGYGVKNSGFVVGSHFPPIGGLQLSFGGVVGTTLLDPDNPETVQAKMDDFRLGLLSRLKEGFLDMGLSVQYAWDFYFTTRPILDEGSTAEAFFRGGETTALFHLSSPFPWEGGKLEPLVEFQYTEMQIGGFLESGAGSQDLSAPTQDIRSFQPAAGIVLSRKWKIGKDGLLAPTLEATVSRELLTPPSPWSVISVGSPAADLSTASGLGDTTSLNLGAGVALTLGGFFLYADYNGVLGDDLNLNALAGGAGMAF